MYIPATLISTLLCWSDGLLVLFRLPTREKLTLHVQFPESVVLMGENISLDEVRVEVGSSVIYGLLIVTRESFSTIVPWKSHSKCTVIPPGGKKVENITVQKRDCCVAWYRTLLELLSTVTTGAGTIKGSNGWLTSFQTHKFCNSMHSPHRSKR